MMGHRKLVGGRTHIACKGRRLQEEEEEKSVKRQGEISTHREMGHVVKELSNQSISFFCRSARKLREGGGWMTKEKLRE